MLMAISFAADLGPVAACGSLFRTLMKSALVNCEPWSELKIAGPPWRASASSKAST
jgi:hypothetical protein